MGPAVAFSEGGKQAFALHVIDRLRENLCATMLLDGVRRTPKSSVPSRRQLGREEVHGDALGSDLAAIHFDDSDRGFDPPR